MRLNIVLACFAALQVSYVIGQSARRQNGWVPSKRLQDVLSNSVQGTNVGIDELLSVSNGNGNGRGRGRGRGRTNTPPRGRTTNTTTTTTTTTTPTTTTTTRPQAQPSGATEAPATAGLTVATLSEIQQEFVTLFQQDVGNIAKFVQMGFHVCVGGCDGCLDLTSEANRGLVPFYQRLRSMYTKWERLLSLADYAVISGLEAVKAGVARDTTGCNFERCSISLDFTSGRTTCANPDSPPRPTFPKGEDASSPRRDLMNAFSLTEEEMVALLGCHSLGATHVDVSGFEGPWDLSRSTLDNGYFQALSQISSFTQKFQARANATQWVGQTVSGVELTMLHADMILQHNFAVGGVENTGMCNGGVPENVRDCPSATSTAPIVLDFARNHENFLLQLRGAMIKMVNTANFDPTKRQEFF